MPKLSRSTLAIGATQFVVQEALEMIVWASESYFSSLTPITIVMSSSLAGAEMMTFFAPASMCARAAGPVVNRPVDSITTSTPRSPHGSLAGSRSARILIDRSPTVRVSPDTDTSCGSVPTTLSYLSRCAMVATSPRSFAATISMPRSPSAALAARQKLRPIRPKPLIPTRIVTVLNLLVDPLIASGSETIGRRPADGAPLLWSRPYQKPQSRHRTGSVHAAASPVRLAGRPSLMASAIVRTFGGPVDPGQAYSSSAAGRPGPVPLGPLAHRRGPGPGPPVPAARPGRAVPDPGCHQCRAQ